jgi:predicted GIY-YIG superfamily endonuclease
MKTAYAYMLECSDGSYYVGCTTTLEQRVSQHQSGELRGYTLKRRPVILVWYQEFSDIQQAILCERKLKGWSRAKKEALIRGDWEDVKRHTSTGKKSGTSS